MSSIRVSVHKRLLFLCVEERKGKSLPHLIIQLRSLLSVFSQVYFSLFVPSFCLCNPLCNPLLGFSHRHGVSLSKVIEKDRASHFGVCNCLPVDTLLLLVLYTQCWSAHCRPSSHFSETHFMQHQWTHKKPITSHYYVSFLPVLWYLCYMYFGFEMWLLGCPSWGA